MKRDSLDQVTELIGALRKLERARDELANYAMYGDELTSVSFSTAPRYVSVELPIVSVEAQKKVAGFLLEIVERQRTDVEIELKKLGVEL